MRATELRASHVAVAVGGVQVVRDVDFAIPGGQIAVVTGPSGSGKSLLLQALAGLTPLSEGGVLVDGREAWTGPAALATPGVVLQDHALLSLLTAAETVSLTLQARRVPRAETERRTDEALAALGLGPARDQLVGTLSGGQRQRVAIARALAVASPLLFLDEPTSELDAANRNLVIALLREQADDGVIVVVVTHDPDIIAAADTAIALPSA